MTQLLFVIGGWIGLLGRGSVLLQVLVAVGLLLGYRAWRFRGRGSASLWRPVLAKVVLLGVMLWMADRNRRHVLARFQPEQQRD